MPINFNQVLLGGRVAADPKTQQLPGGSNKARFAVAVTSYRKGIDGEFKEDTSYINVEAFGYLVDRITKNLRKGTTVLVRGKVQEDKWKDSATGQTRFRTYVWAESVDFVNNNQQNNQQQQPKQNNQPDQEQQRNDYSQQDDIPF